MPCDDKVLSDFVAKNSIHCSTDESHLLHALNLETKHNSRLEVGIASNVV